MSNTPTSKSQTRAIAILGLGASDSYQSAASTLENAGYRPDGIPQGHTWRAAAKLSDADLIAGLTIDYSVYERVEY